MGTRHASGRCRARDVSVFVRSCKLVVSYYEIARGVSDLLWICAVEGSVPHSDTKARLRPRGRLVVFKEIRLAKYGHEVLTWRSRKPPR